MCRKRHKNNPCLRKLTEWNLIILKGNPQGFPMITYTTDGDSSGALCCNGQFGKVTSTCKMSRENISFMSDHQLLYASYKGEIMADHLLITVIITIKQIRNDKNECFRRWSGKIREVMWEQMKIRPDDNNDLLWVFDNNSVL